MNLARWRWPVHVHVQAEFQTPIRFFIHFLRLLDLQYTQEYPHLPYKNNSNQ